MNLPELPPAFITMRRIRQCEGEVAAQLALEHYSLAYGLACARAAMEQAAVIADKHSGQSTLASENSEMYSIQNRWAKVIAAAIRAACKPE
jgi:hypothetical protein